MASTISFSGLASGIDTDSLIKSTSEASRKTREAPLQTKVTELTDTDDSLTELKNRLKKLQTVLLGATTLAGGILEKLAASTDETTVSASASSSARNGSYTISQVSSIATSGKFQLSKGVGVDYAASDEAFSTSDGTLTFRVGEGGTDISVPYTGGSTKLSEIAASINTQTSEATASVVNIGTSGSPQYRLIISSNKTGTENSLYYEDPLNPGSYLEGVDGYGSAAGAKTSAADAVFMIDGISDPITRSSNTINDVIEGVTINLRKINTLTPTTINITDDSSGTQSRVQEFIDAYNKVVGYVAENDQISRDESDPNNIKVVFASLSKTTLDNNALTALRMDFSATVNKAGTYVKILADLGITTDAGAYDKTTGTGGGTLKFDTKVFATAMERESSSVNAVFKKLADRTALTGGTIDQYTGFNRLLDVAINANKTTMSDLNARIAEAESSILKNEESMRARFARMESAMSKMQSQQSQLSSALAGLR